ncbi:MAG: GNAT family N-acetyltransferase [Candidatus Heimdallarchaeota archaeon]
MTKKVTITEPDIFILKKEENNDFVNLMITCFSEGLERDRVNIDEIAKIMRKLNKPIYRLIMKIVKVKMINYGIRIENKLVSALTLSIEKSTATIGNVMTHPDYRRKGYARKLFQRAMNDANKFDLEKVTLDVHAQNHGAIKLYESEGFEKYYHTGKAEFNLSEKELYSDDNSVDLREINKIDKNYFDELLDYCFTQEMLKERNRKKMAKDFIPSRFIKFSWKSRRTKIILLWIIFQ